MTAPGHFEVGILIFDGVEELDFAGPYEVFGMAAAEGLDLALSTVGLVGEQVCGAKGLKVSADLMAADSPHFDLLVVPGGTITRRLQHDAEVIETVRALAAPCRWVLSVCTGALLLGRAGFLDGRRATTHWNALADLRAAAPACQVVDDERYVVDGNVVTSAGVSAGIDASLWLVGQIYGEAVGAEVQKWMEYYPEPPFGQAR